MERKKGNKQKGQDFAFRSLMDGLNANLFITDIETYEILYMNRGMKKLMGQREPEGKICYQVLQKGMDGPCPFCPIEELKEKRASDPDYVCAWEEKNLLTGRIYENYDSLIRWTDGRLVHMQNSLDITDYKNLSREASLDELTGVFNRREGKIRMRYLISKAKAEGVSLIAAMIDVNDLKSVNDSYGHGEGDKMLQYIALLCRERLDGNDIMCRLSGDEFVIVYYGKTLKESEAVMKQILSDLEQRRQEFGIVFHPSFSYGLEECSPEDSRSVNDVISRADENMYAMKRQYHIDEAKKHLNCPEEKLQEAIAAFDYDKAHLYEALAKSTDDYVYVGNMKTGTFRYSQNMVEEFDLPGQIVPNAAAFWADKIHPHDSQAFLESNQEVADGRTENHNVEYRARNRFGEWVWLRCRGHMVRDEEGCPNLFAGIIANLGKKKRIDHTTGLYNKYEFENEVNRQIRQFPNMPFCMIQMGIDNFKNINNLYNRVFGDEVIRILSHKIADILPGNAGLYRMDGDEFCILLKTDLTEDVMEIYHRIYHLCQYQQEFNGKKYFCTVSAGGSFYPKDASDYLTLLKFSGYSMEYSKNQGKNRITFFSDEILNKKKRDLELLELLREDIEHGFMHFRPYYQPQVLAQTGQVMGAEALLRWSCDKYGEVTPVEFIPLLERSNLILGAGMWIFKQAVKQCKEWLKVIPNFVMSVNLSYLQVLENDFVEEIGNVIRESGVPFQNIVMELTENYLIQEQERVNETFQALQGMGIAVAMDDFGTGYSSLGVLKNTPVNLVKIDQTFVREITNSFDAIFIRFIVELCHDVGKKVCLEGVETEEEYQIIKGIGLEYIQGFYFGRPVTAEVFAKKYLEQKIG